MDAEHAHVLTRRSFLGKLAAVGAVIVLGSVVEACTDAASSSGTEPAGPGETTEPP